MTPSWVDVVKEAGEQTCGGPLMLDVPSGIVTKAWRERKKTSQVVQMHNGPSQVMMESTTLSMVHDDQYKHKRGRGGAGIEPSSCKRIPKTTGEGRDTERTEGRNNKKEEEKEKNKRSRSATWQTGSACLTWRLKVLMLNQNVIGNVSELRD